MAKQKRARAAKGVSLLREMQLDDDRPRSNHVKDWLGLEGVADHLASVVSQESLRAGFILGVEGPWGSGKSTLIRITQSRLRTRRNVEVVVFNPWLVGNRDSLLGTLFGDVANAVERIEGGAEPLSEELAEKTVSVAKRLRSYAGHVGAFAKIVEVAGTIAPGASALGQGLGAVSRSLSKFAEAADALPVDQPLSEQKAALEESLKSLAIPIVVFVDDLERLEPAETIEMLRVIRAVGDLPNIIYVLCYDRDVLVANIEHSLSVPSGARYLEKIVQVSLPLPQPEAFTLRRWFFEECAALSGLDIGAPIESDALRRLRRVVDEEGGHRLETPRDVVRALNALKLYWVPIRDYVDFADLVWIQLVRLKAPELYGWIERYVTDVAAITLGGASISKPKRIMKKLKALLEDDPEGFTTAVYRLKNLLPGLKVAFDGEKKPHAEGFHLDRPQMKDFTRQRRLGSPHYYRYYFSFGPAAGEIHEDEVRQALTALKQQDASFASTLVRLAGERKPDGGVRLAPMIDRLSATELTSEQAALLLRGLADCMDGAFFLDLESFSVTRSWEAGERLWHDALACVEPAMRVDLLVDIARTGNALGWIARCLHYGRYRASQETEPVLSAEDYSHVARVFASRLDSGLPIAHAAWLDGIFYLWSDVIGKENIRAKVAERTESDEDFIRLLHAARGWIGADRIYRPLRSAELSRFVDFEEARSRAALIAGRGSKFEPEIQHMIAQVMIAFEEGDQHPYRYGNGDES